jgi:hypothetical protein
MATPESREPQGQSVIDRIECFPCLRGATSHALRKAVVRVQVAGPEQPGIGGRSRRIQAVKRRESRRNAESQCEAISQVSRAAPLCGKVSPSHVLYHRS